MSEHDDKGEGEGGGTVTPIRETSETSPFEDTLKLLGWAAEKTRLAANLLDLAATELGEIRDALGGDKKPAGKKSVTPVLLVGAALMTMVAGGTMMYAGAISAGNKRRRDSEVRAGEVKAPETFSGRLAWVARMVALEARDQVAGAGGTAVAAWRILRGSADVRTAPARSDAN